VIALLDVNVLVALAWPNHTHHQAARRWFLRQRKQGWATCPSTENGFIRVSSNTRIIPEARTPAEAAGLLSDLLALEGHVRWFEEASVLEDRWVRLHMIYSHRQITDAHLLAVALRHGGQLATFDHGVCNLLPPGADAETSVQLISSS